jgi:hypothetical protein
MDIKLLKEIISQDYSKIEEILKYIGCDRIAKHNKEYRCAKDQKDYNSTRVVVKLNPQLTARIYDLIPVKGDIFIIIMELKKCSLNEAIKICCNAIGVKYTSSCKTNKKRRRIAFGGFFSDIKVENDIRYEITTYPNEILDSYENKGNILFFNDGINYEVQTEFDIMYDFETNRITVPWRNLNGDIVGIMGRYNGTLEECDSLNISKWLPLPNLSFAKSQLLYGLYQNYKCILQEGRVYVGESEKFVLQAKSFGVNNVVSIGSHDISDTQRGILLSLGVDIVTCMDADIPDEFNVEQCKNLKSTSNLVGGKVGFVMNDDILIGKESPTDRGLDTWNKCVAEDNIFWV